MKRFHVHVAVSDLAQSIRFYSQLFATEPAVVKPDYAKWMLEDPRINFAISHRGGKPGINHLGLQVETAGELEEIHSRLGRAEASIVEEAGVACCYARSDKYWVTDPEGIAWETYRNLGSVPFFGEAATGVAGADRACCAPAGAATATADPTAHATPAACCAPASAATVAKGGCCS